MQESSQSILEPKFLKKLEALSLASRRPFSGHLQGERRSRSRGSSTEFADYRDYSPGDDLRYVDWKAYGRLDKLYVKLFLAEHNLGLHLVVDTSASMERGSPLPKAVYARRVAAALGYIALASYDSVDYAPFSDDLGSISPTMRGRPAISGFLRFLERQPHGAGTTDFGRSLRRRAMQIRNPGIVVVVSDFFVDGYDDGLKALLSRGCQVVVIHVWAEEDVSPSSTGQLRLHDCETGETRDVSMSPEVLEQYKQRSLDYCRRLREFAGSHNIDYIYAQAKEPFEDVVLALLRSRGVLR